MTEPPQESGSRRSFLKRAGALAATAAAGRAPAAQTAGKAETPARPKVIDCHAHLHHRGRASWEADDRALIDAADRLGIDVLCCSMLTPRRPATADGFRECNRWVLDGAKRFPGRVLGYAYVNPGCGAEAVDEVRRCVLDHGFIGVKLYNEHFCTDPIVFPIVEAAIELGVPILQHAGHIHYFLEDQPRISDGARIAELAARYPEARLICAHVCGGGDWEWTIKALRHAPSVFLDTSGSVPDDGVVEMAAKTLGVDRLLFGCDMSMTNGVGRIRGADLTDDEKARIFGGNMAKLLGGRV
ncbi:amidohydrolase family protein [Planctomyces sp. SH-PL62]|uniref:amidohydrolase family protein n=1 Tax=Planctomyces sp. SH-PL62 TaxID=1636152 RepID=UPI00078B8D87|nr:amidohydrolase family protein [Planctomyces sp. SH-PL62]AMV37735.1 Amidohydrolase [Planctomyces sp. SH-PL62]